MQGLKTTDPREAWECWADLHERWRDNRFTHSPYDYDPDRKVALDEGLFLPAGTLLKSTPRIWLPSGHIVPVPIRGGARLFDNASNHVLSVDSTPITAAPFTMAIWGRTSSAALLLGAMSIGDKDVAEDYWSINWVGTLAGDPVQFEANDGGAVTANTSTGFTANTWAHVCGVEISSSSRAAFINGGSKGTNATLRSPDNADCVRIGRRAPGSTSQDFLGDLAEAAIWDDDLTDDEVALLGKGVSALMVRPSNLVFYCPIIGAYSPEIDTVGGLSLTVTGAVKSDHPRIFYMPTPPTLLQTPSGAPVTESMALKTASAAVLAATVAVTAAAGLETASAEHLASTAALVALMGLPTATADNLAAPAPGIGTAMALATASGEQLVLIAALAAVMGIEASSAEHLAAIAAIVATLGLETATAAHLAAAPPSLGTLMATETASALQNAITFAIVAALASETANATHLVATAAIVALMGLETASAISPPASDSQAGNNVTETMALETAAAAQLATTAALIAAMNKQTADASGLAATASLVLFAALETASAEELAATVQLVAAMALQTATGSQPNAVAALAALMALKTASAAHLAIGVLALGPAFVFIRLLASETPTLFRMASHLPTIEALASETPTIRRLAYDLPVERLMGGGNAVIEKVAKET